MNILLYISNIIILIFFLTLMFLACFYLIGSFFAAYKAKGVPYVPSYDEDLKRMKEYLKLDLKGKTLIDLGCGDGKALRFFIRNFGIAKGVGYEFNVPAITFGRFYNWYNKIENIEIHKGDFTKVDISGYDYIYIYLLSEYMAKIEDFVFENMREDTIIISNTFRFTKHEPYHVTSNEKGRDRILLYKKN